MGNINTTPDNRANSTHFTVNLKDYSSVKVCLKDDINTIKTLFTGVTDNNYVDRFCNEVHELLHQASPENIHLLTPDANTDSDDDEDGNRLILFRPWGNTQYTDKYVGVIKLDIPEDRTPDNIKKTLTINIRSRFDKGNRSNFLLYVFEKALDSSGKIFGDMEILASEIDVWDLLLMTSFIHHLHHAAKKGIFRQYQDFEHNNSRIKGRIDISRYIRNNIPFNGNISYSSREYSADNPINVLILRAYCNLDRRYHSLLNRLLLRDPIARQALTLLKNEVSGWQRTSDHIAIQKANRKIANSLYRDYEQLRKTSIAVLNRMGANAFFTSDAADNRQAPYSAAGMLIDMPKLWEKFLYNTVFQKHAGTATTYKQESEPILGGVRFAKPDFLLQDKGIVLDAKYKDKWGKTLENSWQNLRDDTYQLISYSLIFNCKYCGVIFPVSEKKLPINENLLFNAESQDFQPLIKEVSISRYCRDRFFIRIPYIVPQSTENDVLYRSAFEKSDLLVMNTLKYLEAKGQPRRIAKHTTDD